MSAYLNFDLGSNREACRELIDELRGLGGKPNEYVNEEGTAKQYCFSVPFELKSQLEKYLRHMLRRADEMDIDRCRVELRHVLARIGPDGAVATEHSGNPIWNGVATAYVATDPRLIEIHHVVIAPKRGEQHLHSSRPVKHPDIAGLRRDREKTASLFKDVEGATISSTLERVVARWEWPFERTEESQHRTSMRRRLGVSDHRALNFFELCAEIKRNHDYKVRDVEQLRSRAIATLDACRCIAMAQRVTPLVMGIGLIPMMPGPEGLRLADYFCTRAVSYGATPEAAQALLGAFDELMFLLVNFGHSPILSAPDQYDQVFDWIELLHRTNGARSKPAQMKAAAEQHQLMATSERVLRITPSIPFRRLDETARKVLTERFGARFDVRNLGILGVPFRTIADAGGTRIGGCLFALVSAPNLDRAALVHLAMCEHIFLHREPFKLEDPPRSATAISASQTEPATRKDEGMNLRKRQAIEHNQLWNALEAVWDEQGTRLEQIATRFPADHAVYLKYEAKLQALKQDIETDTQLGKLMKRIWTAITGTSQDYLWQARKQAGLPSRNPIMKSKKAQAR